MTDEKDLSIIPDEDRSNKSRDVRRMEKFLGQVGKRVLKDHRDLQNIALFEDKINNLGEIVTKKKKVTTRSNAIEQVLLKERDEFERMQGVRDKYIGALDKALENNVDPETVAMIMQKINVNESQASKHLDNIRNCLEKTRAEINKQAKDAASLLRDVAQSDFERLKHEDKMDLAYAALAKKMNLSKDELIARIAAAE